LVELLSRRLDAGRRRNSQIAGANRKLTVENSLRVLKKFLKRA
jgi:hypothetical protein